MERKVLGIFCPDDLYRMLRHPEHDYKLQADIDLNGAYWTPPASFASKLDGGGKTIRNGRIACAQNGCLGFFGTVTETGEIRDLRLENLQLVSDDATRYVGGIAGINRGSLENITVTGTLTDISLDSTLGAVAGCNEGIIQNVRSELHITAPEGKPQALVGENKGQAQGIWRDHRYSDRPLSQESLAMRRAAISHSHRMGSHPWHVPAQLKFVSPYVASCSQTFLPGETYYGLPYTNKYGSYERFLYCLDSSNTVKPWVMELGDGFDGFDRYMGADCSGNIYWSWARVCPGIRFAATAHMVPVPENIRDYGILPIGEYWAEPDEEDRPDTRRIQEKNGQEHMMECLAQARLGDAIVNWLPESGGHTKLLTADPEIYRDENGRIDREVSILITNELGGTGSDLNGGYSRWCLNRRNKLAVLMRQCYVPITCRELEVGQRVPVQWNNNITGESNVLLERLLSDVCETFWDNKATSKQRSAREKRRLLDEFQCFWKNDLCHILRILEALLSDLFNTL